MPLNVRWRLDFQLIFTISEITYIIPFLLMNIRAFVRALLFLAHSQLGARKPVSVEARELLLSDGQQLPYRKYKWKNNSPIIGRILALNGLAIAGNLDDRMVHVCKSLALCGFEVFSPAYYELNHLTISRKSIEDIALTIPAVAKLDRKSTYSPISLFAPSFAGGMILIAASRYDNPSYVNAICTIGAYANTRESIRYALEREDNDDYGRLVLMYNFIDQATPQFSGLKKALKVAILDNGLKRKHPELPTLMAEYRADESSHIAGLIGNKAYRLTHWNKVVEIDAKGAYFMKHFDVLPQISQLKAPTILIHGATDDVIPPTESQKLFNAMTAKGIPVKLVITPFISHGDTGFKWNLIGELWKMIDAFTFFFRNAMTR